MKTMKQWKESKLSLEKFLQIGDKVDEELRLYFIEVLPPASWTNDCIQIGEPYDCNANGQDTYLTLHFKSNGWVYVGDKCKNKTITNEKRFPSYR